MIVRCLASGLCCFILAIPISLAAPQLGIGRINSNLRVDLKGESGVEYLLESAPTITTNRWNLLADLTLTNNSQTWVEAMLHEQQFFRLTEIPQTQITATAPDFRLLDHNGRSR